jgi:hypothetical protein
MRINSSADSAAAFKTALQGPPLAMRKTTAAVAAAAALLACGPASGSLPAVVQSGSRT